jgi:apolipoprotein N-acyltransferase
MIGRDGEPYGHYRKMKTMPFGEHVPFADSLPILKSATSGVLAGFTTSLQRGTEHAAFEIGAATVVPLICYETLFPGFVEEAIPPKNRGTVLVGLSNNAWFGDTVQPFQHVNASILRAVENRVPFVHVLNNGPSVVVLPNGRIIFESNAREAGGYLVDVPFREATVVN